MRFIDLVAPSDEIDPTFDNRLSKVVWMGIPSLWQFGLHKETANDYGQTGEAEPCAAGLTLLAPATDGRRSSCRLLLL
jgi:hypothetical protein